MEEVFSVGGLPILAYCFGDLAVAICAHELQFFCLAPVGVGFPLLYLSHLPADLLLVELNPVIIVLRTRAEPSLRWPAQGAGLFGKMPHVLEYHAYYSLLNI